MGSSFAVRLVVTVAVAVIAMAGATAVLMVLSSPGSTRLYPVSNEGFASASSSAVPSLAAALPKMPKLWFQDAETAKSTIAALGFDLEIRSLTGDEVKDPADWIVLGQAPAPGDDLKTTTPISVEVTPKDMPVPNPTTTSGSPPHSAIEPSAVAVAEVVDVQVVRVG
ncbi:hypothetical protein ACGFIJ_27690 [Microbispora bryophytorum]|uniref:hypothetical protein n=1 Tax=Microbispora bryophytorum TaxID=1460882 RepID=UPI0037193957